VLFVTHDIDEAVFLSDRVCVLASRPGRVRAVLDVPLPRPRVFEQQLSPAFLALKRHIRDLIQEEVTPTPIRGHVDREWLSGTAMNRMGNARTARG
jgi:ABC-type nitrate/sulfonate/bicarbonate transport system ATPase subunit